jgi:hypothetical protein
MAKIKAAKAKTGKYKGEIVLMPKQGKYPVTKKGKLHCGRVSAAKAYGTMHGHLNKLNRSGLKKYAKKCKTKK